MKKVISLCSLLLVTGCATINKDSSTIYHSSGKASFYWQGQRTASGEKFNPNGLTAAHKTLKMGSRVKVVNKRNNKSVVVTINDRGPFIKGRIIDLSKRAAAELGFVNSGITDVDIYVID